MWVSAKLHVVQFKAPLPRVWSFKRTQEILELNSSAGVLRPLDYLPKTSKHNQMFNVVQYNLPSNKFPLWCAANRKFRDSSVSSLLSCAVRSESLRNCSLLIHLDPPGSTDAIWCWLFHLSVDQNKGISSSYNRRSTASTAIPTVSIAERFCRIRHYFAQRIVETLLRCYISQYLETWREPGPTQLGLTIADQSRINREPIAVFHRHFLKIESIWLLDFELCCFDSSLLIIGYHYWTQCLGRP